jgi:sulfur-carrier protein
MEERRLATEEAFLGISAPGGFHPSWCAVHAPPHGNRLPLPLARTRRYNPPVPTASSTIRVKVLFFGRLKEIVGRAEDGAELTEGAPIEALFTRYAAHHPELSTYRSSLVASRNQEFAPWNTPLHSGDEVAFLPPVSGG